MMQRPELDRVENLSMNDMMTGVIVTMSPGQWDKLLQEAYDRGCTLLEIDKNEMPAAAFRKAA